MASAPQLLLESGPLPHGRHELTAVVRGQPGKESVDGGVGVGIDAFDCIGNMCPYSRFSSSGELSSEGW